MESTLNKILQKGDKVKFISKSGIYSNFIPYGTVGEVLDIIISESLINAYFIKFGELKFWLTYYSIEKIS